MSIDDGPATAPERRRPTGWIVLTAVLAMLASALGLWALSAQADANDAEEKLAAQAQRQAAGSDEQVDAFKAQAEAAQACLSGALGALDEAFSSGGVQAAVTELETLSGQCRSASTP